MTTASQDNNTAFPLLRFSPKQNNAYLWTILFKNAKIYFSFLFAYSTEFSMETQALGKRKSQSRDANHVKVPPHSIEAEQSVLGGLMLDNRAWDQIADRVHEHDFYRHDHRLIYRVMSKLTEQNKPLDVLTVSEALREIHELENAGGEVYLFELANNIPSVANITAYADIVRERSVLRQLIATANEIAGNAFNPDGRSSIELLDAAERQVFAISEQGVRAGGPANIKEFLSKTMDKIDLLFQSKNPITGISTGYHDFDEMTSGLQQSDLVIIAGRPSMGKTTYAMNIAEHVAIKNKLPVLVFSMEMPGESIVMRLLSSLCRIDQLRLRTGKLEDEDWPRISSTVSMLSEAPLFIDDSPALSPAELRARSRRIAKEHGQLGLIVVDYLQLMQVPGHSENRTAEISEISRSLKSLAKELKVPVIALSQLNRGLEQRADKRPVMSDLRESGAIEQDADLIVFIYRDEVYNENTSDKGTAEIIIAKQRNGPIGKVRLTFLGQYTCFENFAYNPYH
jgi:replicative DNA helicase